MKNQELKTSFVLPLSELKSHSSSLETLFDLFSRTELLEQELTTKEERLAQLELQGKDEARELKELTTKKTSFEEDKRLLQSLEMKKKETLKGTEERQRATIRLEEIGIKIAELKQESAELDKISVHLGAELTQHQQEYLPLETTIKLQNLLSAIEVCLTHPTFEENKACPVCKTSLAEAQIEDLRSGLAKTDFSKIKARESDLARFIMKKESELEQIKDQNKRITEELLSRSKEAETLQIIMLQVIPNPEILENELKSSQKRVWEQEKLLKDEERLSAILSKTRDQYLALKNEIAAKIQIKNQHFEKLSSVISPMTFIKEINQETITIIKIEARKLSSFMESEAQGEKLKQEKSYLDENAKEAETNLAKIKLALATLETRITNLTVTLNKELNGKKASELINDLAQRVKEQATNQGFRERELKSQELKLKESQSRLYTLDELIKDIDLQFTKEIHALRDFSKVSLPCLTSELSLLVSKLEHLNLELTSSVALLIPLKDLIESQKVIYKEKTTELKMNFASVRARLEDWEKQQDRITLLVLKSQDLTQKLERRSRLYEVLGKDELRTFVLSLVEENLITQTNDELQKLCQGRYEIVHQSRRMKLTPEFYILDKFREGGLRKVSTLSGGETFMVSLAMALGLAEMTRGKAEIDTLFIDEGFGTLDQDSLEDVLDMLKQIQTRGLMVGIISHVKVLTNALPVNLQLTKKQDGTSSVSMQYN